MSGKAGRTGGELFIVDNSDQDWKVLQYLRDWCELSEAIDIATGYFEIGSLLGLQDEWQKVDRIRILMGDEVSLRTKKAFEDGLAAVKQHLEQSIEDAKLENDFLEGVPAIVGGLRSGKIQCRVYRKDKFHAKAYITHARQAVIGSFALVGSSNFTYPGLAENVELNVQITGRQVVPLQEWYEAHWAQAEDVTPDILKTIERHVQERTPFEVYAKSLDEYFAGREKMLKTWEKEDSVIYPMLSKYQQDGYHSALQMAAQWNGALICDGVGLGKTYIGLMLIECLIRSRKRVLLVVPKSTRESVWESRINQYLRPVYRRRLKDNLDTRSHTDFGREGTVKDDDLQYYREEIDAVIIDEAHNFRHPYRNRSEMLMDICKGKQVFMLTATPVNNSLLDLYHLMDYFVQDRQDCFSCLGVNNLRRLFSGPEKRFQEASKHSDWEGLDEVTRFLEDQRIFKAILIQRSRSYVKESEAISENRPCFPERQRPRVIDYSLKKVYATLYAELREAFHRESPFLTLALYNTTAYDKDPDRRTVEYQRQVVGLIRTLLLKRLESSFRAFEASTENLLAKMARFLHRHSPQLYEAWTTTNRRWWSIVQEHINQRLEREEAEEEDDIPEEDDDFLPEDHDMERLLQDVQSDMVQLTDFLSKIYRRFYVREHEGKHIDPERDDKLQKLLATLTGEPAEGEPDIRGQKIVIFTEFRDTARYLFAQLRDVAKIPRVEEIDSTRKVKREHVIKRFAPYYNCTEDELPDYLEDPINVLISTDVLSEGLNLQDASLVINYDLHWNPVRLMQRIGRVDRRLDWDKEAAIARPAHLDRKVFFWNFMPPGELEDILHLFARVTGKVLRINAVLGIEGALLTPDDPDMSLREFNKNYEGRQSVEEKMENALRALRQADPSLQARVADMPPRAFSGKADTQPPLNKGIFCAYRLPPATGKPPRDAQMELFDEREDAATLEPQGELVWLFRDHATGQVHEGLEDIWQAIRCQPDTPRHVSLTPEALIEARKAIERDKVQRLLRNRGLPASARATLVCWMDIS